MRLASLLSVGWLAVTLAISVGTIEAAEVTVGREATVKSVAGLNVRSAPSQDAPVLAVAEGGDFVNVLEESGAWFRVEYDGTVGWVSGEYLGPARDRGAVSTRGSRRGDAVVTESGVLLRVPYRSQLDGSAYQAANCGPASVGMALEAFGDYLPTTDIRRAANRMQGTTGWYEAGTSLDVLAAIAEQHGLIVRGLHAEHGYEPWTPEDVRQALRNGHVVIPQVHLATLPGQEHSNRAVDHFIVIVGYEGDHFIYHDPAFSGAGGHSLWISEERLMLAWRRGDYPFAAFSLGPGAGMEPLIAPRPARLPPAQAAPAAQPASAQDGRPAGVPALAHDPAANGALRRMLEAEVAVNSPAPPAEPRLAEPSEIVEPPRSEPPPDPALAAPAAQPDAAVTIPSPVATAAYRPMRAWPIVLLAALALSLLGSRRLVPGGRGAG
jgi:uncharacterized protein YraI